MKEVSRERLATAPQVGVYEGNAPKVETALAETSFSIAEIMDQKANKKFEMDFQNEAADQINQAYRRNENNPDQLNKELDSIRGGLIQTVPFNLHDDFNSQFKRASQPYVNKSTEGADRLLTDQVKESSLRNIDLAKTDLGAYAADLLSDNPARVADATAAGQEKLREAFNTISQVNANGVPVFSATERFSMAKELVDETAYRSVRESFDDATDKRAFLKKFEDGELKASIFLDQDQNFISASVKERMDRSVYEKTVNYMESEIESITKQAKEQAELTANVTLLDGVMNGEAILDPTNNKHQKAVDDYYKTLAPHITNLPLEQKSKAIVDFVSKAGVWPDSLKSGVIAQLSNGSPGQKAVAADLVNAISESNPQTVYQINDSIRARAKAIANNINAGLDPETATQYAENSIFKKDSPEYKVREKRFNDPKNGERIPFDKGMYTKLFSSDPEIPPAMEADYDILNSSYYMDQSLDAKGSSELANEKVALLWKVTEVDGNKRWMKYAPEAMYKNDVGTEWIGEQLRSELGKIPSISEKGAEENIVLSVHPGTTRFPNPAYLVWSRDEYGKPAPYLNERGKQVVFKPDYQTSPQFQALLKEFNGDKQTAMIAARNRRRQALSKQEKSDKNREFKKARAEAFKTGVENLLGIDDAN